MPKIEPFTVKDCALAAIATGARAQNLRELHQRIGEADAGCFYYHFWGGLLRARFEDPEYRNDFAAWAAHGLRDPRLAERLGIIDPAAYPNLEELRHAVLEVIEERLDESEMVPWAKGDHQFHFIRSQMVVFRTGDQVERTEALPAAVARMSPGSVFYHFVDARLRHESSLDDLCVWLEQFGHEFQDLRERLTAVDRSFVGLLELRERLTDLVHRRIGGPHP